MAIKASSYKNWCTENISPQSWTRIILRCITPLREKGISLSQIENADPDFELDQELFDLLNTALSELYDMKVEESILVGH